MISNISAAEFSVDSPLIYALYAVIVLFVVVESVFYLIKSINRAKQIGMDMGVIKKVITTSVSFSVLPAIGVAIGVVTLVGALGVAFPAIRLSVIGSLQYEAQMAAGAAEALTGTPDGLTALMERGGVTAREFVTIASVMTMAIIIGPVLVTLGYKKFQPQLAKLGNLKGSADGKINLGELAFAVVFIGMIIGYFGMSIASIAGYTELADGSTVNSVTLVASYYNFIAVIVAALCMYVFELLIKNLNWKWLDNFSTAFSMLIAMAVVAVISYFCNKNGWDPAVATSVAAVMM